MTPIDAALAAAGRSYAIASRGGRRAREVGLVVLGLFAVTALAVLVIGLTPTPMEISFEDLRAARYQDRTSWLRLEGDLEPADVTLQDYDAYVLRDRNDPSLAVTVLSPEPLPTGPTDVTGQPLGGVRAPGTFEALYADVPTEPARHDPWPLIALPALVGLVMLLGGRVGYPVMRRESRRPGLPAKPLAPHQTLSARWNGRIGGEELPLGERRPCSVAVAPGDNVVTLIVSDEHGTRSVAVRRAIPKVSGRVCHISGCRPGLEVHGTGADIVFELDSAADRDRLAASLI